MSGPQKSTKAHASFQKDFEVMIPGVSQKVAISGSSVTSSTFQSTSTLLRLFATNDCYIVFGNAGSPPTADQTGAGYFIPGGIVDFVGVPPGMDRLAVITYAQNGTLFIAEGAA